MPSPAHEEAMRLLIEAFLKKEDVGDAELRLKNLTATGIADLHITIAVLALRKGDVASAADQAQRAQALDPRSTKLTFFWLDFTLQRKT
jgi:hypothetical protein